MQLAAWELGVGSCPASLYEFEETRTILGFPDEWHLRIALSFGYALEEEKISAPPKKGGRMSWMRSFIGISGKFWSNDAYDRIELTND